MYHVICSHGRCFGTHTASILMPRAGRRGRESVSIFTFNTSITPKVLVYAAFMGPRNLDRGLPNFRRSYTCVLLQGHPRGFRCNGEARLCDRSKRVTGVACTRCSHSRASNWRFSRTEFHLFARVYLKHVVHGVLHIPSHRSHLISRLWPHSKMNG